VGSDLRSLVQPATLAQEQTLPLVTPLRPLFPTGLRRGSTVAVAATGHQGTTSLALGLAAAASAAGSWCAVVGVPDLGLVAAAELGLELHRLALVPSVPPADWTPVVGALLDAVDLVFARPPTRLRLGDARRLTARARERKAVLVPLLGAAGSKGPWAEGVDVRLEVAAGGWEGPDAGHGRLGQRRAVVTAGGRGSATRARHVEVWLPGPSGGIEPVLPGFAGADIERLAPAPLPAFRTAG
jgi:hypothetical protein